MPCFQSSCLGADAEEDFLQVTERMCCVHNGHAPCAVLHRSRRAQMSLCLYVLSSISVIVSAGSVP